jgi:hypothetical protein
VRAAWVLDGPVSVVERRDQDRIGDLDRRDATSTTMIAARVGRRRYHAPTGRAAGYHTLGLVATGHVFHLPYADAPDRFFITAGAGPFADIGGSYLLTRHLGVGASLGAQATYARAWGVHTSTDARSDFVSAELGAMRVEVTVYF